MAKRAHFSDGKIVCSNCGASLDEGAGACSDCGDVMEGDFEASVCAYCGTILDNSTDLCSNCGLQFKKAPEEKRQEDEEFLKRLLDWGSGEKQETAEAPAAQPAPEVPGPVESTGAEIPAEPVHDFASQEIQEIENTAEVVTELGKEVEQMSSMKGAIDSAKTLDTSDIEKDIQKTKEALVAIDYSEEGALKKKAELLKRLTHLSKEKERIQNAAESVKNIEDTYNKAMSDQKAELDKKEKELEMRLDAFKQEIERRKKEAEQIKDKENGLAMREKALQEKISKIQAKEKDLETLKKNLTSELTGLAKKKENIERLMELEKHYINKGKWIVDKEGLIMLADMPKDLRKEWMETQQKINEELKKGASIQELEETIEKEYYAKLEDVGLKNAELTKRIETLEREREMVSKEEKKTEGLDEDIRKVLKILDDLLENLSPELIEKFAKSKDFELYEKVMDKYEL